jgi:hypothetical protein
VASACASPSAATGSGLEGGVEVDGQLAALAALPTRSAAAAPDTVAALVDDPANLDAQPRASLPVRIRRGGHRMNSIAMATEVPTARVPLERGGHQWLAVSGDIVERYLVSFRAPAAALAPLIPAPLAIDSLRGHGFVSVCALEVRRMGVAATPGFLRFHNLEFLYRVGVRFRGEPTFLTLRRCPSGRPPPGRRPDPA